MCVYVRACARREKEGGGPWTRQARDRLQSTWKKKRRRSCIGRFLAGFPPTNALFPEAPQPATAAAVAEKKVCYNRFFFLSSSEKQLQVATNFNEFVMHLLAVDVSLEEARVLRMRGDFGLHDGGGCHVIFVLLPVNSVGGREELVGSEQRNPAGGEEGVVVVRRENQILRRHEGLVGVLRRHSVHSIHNQQRHEKKRKTLRLLCFSSFLTRISGTFSCFCSHCQNS